MEYYTYLDRLYEIISQKKKLNNGIKIKHPITCIRGRKTIWANFQIINKSINRLDNHFLKYIISELSCDCNLSQEEDGQLYINGIFKEKHIENVIKNYITNYIKCKSCNSFDTYMIKENRINKVNCNVCKTSYQVQRIMMNHRN